MVSTEKIMVINAADLLSIPETKADIILILNRDTTLANGTLPFPDNPIDGQFYTLITKSQITNFGVDTKGRLINEFPITLLAGEIISWIFDETANTWFCKTNYARWGAVAGTLSNQTDLQTALNGKQPTGNYLAPDGNGSALTGLTKTQVGLSNVDNTTDAGKPVSTAQQTALNLKANLASPAFTGTPTGITATHVGLGNVNNTSDANKPVSSATQTALNAKQNTITPGTSAQYLKGDFSLGTYVGYSINVQALTSSPADGQTIFFGNLPKAPVTAGATSKIFIRQAGTIRRAEIYCFSGTAGTNEAWPMSIRLNNTTDTLIASVAAATSERVFSNVALNIAVVAGDFIEIKCVNPTWVTNPLTTIFGGYVYIQ